MGKNILQKIASTKRKEVEAMTRLIPLEAIMESALDCDRIPLSMSGSILSKPVAVIAEHKRRSPSKGEISPMSDVDAIAMAYDANGAAAMSVLTDTPYFGGSLADFAVARMAAPSLPLLRKEFIVDEYQIYQARLYGADAILLIASMIGGKVLARFNNLAHSLGLQTLVEIHSADELHSLPADADMVGINNRDLTSFHTDILNCARLIGKLPPGMVKVAESGMRNATDVKMLREAGFDAFLIGEALMSTPDPGMTLKRLITEAS